MSAPVDISARDFKQALIRAGDRVCETRDELCALDAAAGDGDLGATLATGFTYVREALEESDEGAPSAMLTLVGLQLARKAPSTIGALLASAFLRAGKELNGVSDLQAGHVAAMLAATAAAVAERGGATIGQRTILDAMEGAATAAAVAFANGDDASETLHAAVAGARSAAAATADMEPRHGRAGWIGERARGFQDAGAVAWATYLSGFEEAVAAQVGGI
jgi:dihydroxyacetone kinase-like protein